VVRLLIVEGGARPDHARHDGFRPLLIAAGEGQLAACQQLIQAGAPLDDHTPDGAQCLMPAYLSSPSPAALQVPAGRQQRWGGCWLGGWAEAEALWRWLTCLCLCGGAVHGVWQAPPRCSWPRREGTRRQSTCCCTAARPKTAPVRQPPPRPPFCLSRMHACVMWAPCMLGWVPVRRCSLPHAWRERPIYAIDAMSSSAASS
jgi:hypothetical protein